MSANPRTFEYILAGVDNLVGRGHFHNGAGFRPTQGDALQAYYDYLHSDEFTVEEKLKGFFEIPTGVGKTAVFLAILDEAHRVARANNDKLRAMIVVPSIPIMEQMRDEIAEWAPDYNNTTGFYGGDYRDIGDELTIIIYNSWVKLMENGEIDSSNVDILVSDEAHRGTSERRITNIFNSFAKGTLQVAFTATASFDEDKSVEQSHGHRIFSRGISESVRLGELAEYIQVQLYVIRTEPPQLSEDFEEVRESESVRLGKKQEAWMRNMVAVLRDRRDIHTDDLLTDNKSGFYVSGTEMADRMAELANADPVLQERARAQGKKGVMISLHSKLSPEEQVARLKAFKRGDYLAGASDSQLKEGYNDPTLKNVFDYLRGSLVDKAQIIGRAARKWFNEAKQRYEGATIVDTIVYEGSDDPEQDESNKKYAIRYAIMAWAVLEGTAVFAPEFEEKREGNGGGEGGRVRAELGLNVTSYINLEDIQAIHAYQQKLIEGVPIPLTDEMYEELKNAIEKAQISYPKLLNSIKNLPPTINLEKVKNWLRITDRAVTVIQEEFDIVLNAAKSLEESEFITFTKEMRENFQGLANRLRTKDKDFVSILKDAGLNDFIKSTRIWNNPKQSIGSVSRHQWNVVMQTLAPHDRIPLTEEMRNFLRGEVSRVGLSPSTLAKSLNDNRVNEAKIKAWMHLKSAIKNVAIGEWDFVIGSLKTMPDKTLTINTPSVQHTTLTPSP